MPPAHDPFSPDNQRRLCHDAAERNNEQIPPEFEFQELDVSGRKDRPRRGLDDALSLLLACRIKTLYVAKLDRLTRRGMGHVGLILDELEKVGGRIVFVADGLDTSKPGVRLIIAILAEQARAESDIYRALRKAQEDKKNEPGAADFYYGEMEMRRHPSASTHGANGSS
jgi:DNA invertase Pin-like site-specific DNA recombinase